MLLGPDAHAADAEMTASGESNDAAGRTSRVPKVNIADTTRMAGLGLWPYIITALRSLWATLIRLCQRMLYIRAEVSGYVSTTLFEALTCFFAKEAEMQGLT